MYVLDTTTICGLATHACGYKIIWYVQGTNTTTYMLSLCSYGVLMDGIEVWVDYLGTGSYPVLPCLLLINAKKTLTQALLLAASFGNPISTCRRT